MASKVPKLLSHLNKWPELTTLLTQKLFKWLMVLFVGELQTDAEILVWDFFFIKGFNVMFRIALTVLELLQTELLKLSSYS